MHPVASWSIPGTKHILAQRWQSLGGCPLTAGWGRGPVGRGDRCLAQLLLLHSGWATGYQSDAWQEKNLAASGPSVRLLSGRVGPLGACVGLVHSPGRYPGTPGRETLHSR